MARPGLSNSNPRVPRAAPRRPMGPDELDPLDAAASPITPDLDVRRQPDPDIQRQRSARHRELVASGMSMEEAAAAMVAEDGARIRAQRRAAEDSAAASWAAANAPTDPLDEPRTVEELRDMGLFGESEPGPRTVDGMPVRRPQEFTTEREAQGYTTRTPISATDRAFRNGGLLRGDPTAAFEPSQRDIDMEARGFLPVFGPDGSVGYSVASSDPASSIPGAPGRRGRRADLEGPLMRDGKPVYQTDAGGNVVKDKDGFPVPAPMYESQNVLGPTGMMYVYRPSEETRAYNADLADEQRIRRQANAAGMSADDIAAMDPAARRRAVSDARDARQRQLLDNVRAVGMLTGGQPSWGRGGTGTTAMQYLQMPQDWRNAVMAQNLAPGLDGTTPLTVEATSNKNAMRLLTADLLREGMQGQGGGDVFKQKNRDAAQAAFDKMYDDAGHGGRTGRAYTPADRNRFVNYLRNQYGLSQPEAEAIADSRGLAAEIVPTPPPPAAGADPSAGTAAAIL